jgi:hypothetical protein
MLLDAAGRSPEVGLLQYVRQAYHRGIPEKIEGRRRLAARCGISTAIFSGRALFGCAVLCLRFAFS